jgi:hypothetical protein
LPDKLLQCQLNKKLIYSEITLPKYIVLLWRSDVDGGDQRMAQRYFRIQRLSLFFTTIQSDPTATNTGTAIFYVKYGCIKKPAKSCHKKSDRAT